MNRHSYLLLLLAGVALLTGCSMNWGSLRIASSENVPVEAKVLKRNATGEDCASQLIVIPLGKLNPNIEAAIRDAIIKVHDANALINVAVYQDLLFTFIFNRVCVRVVGDAVTVQKP